MGRYPWVVSACIIASIIVVFAQTSAAQAPRIIGHWSGLGGSDVGDGVTGELFGHIGPMGPTYDYDVGVDSMGRPNLVWAAPTLATIQGNGVVKFAYWDGAIWRGMKNPDGPDSFGLGNSCQLVNLPSGPAVIYNSADMTVYTALRYVMWNGTAWQQDLYGHCTGPIERFQGMPRRAGQAALPLPALRRLGVISLLFLLERHVARGPWRKR